MNAILDYLVNVILPWAPFTFVILLCAYFRVRSIRIDAQELRARVKKAKADILEDGIVEGPKGPYVPHKPWGTGIGTGTPSETKQRKGRGPHGLPFH